MDFFYDLSRIGFKPFLTVLCTHNIDPVTPRLDKNHFVQLFGKR